MLSATHHLVVFGVLVVLIGGQDLVLKPSQDKHTLPVGHSIVFTCQFTKESENSNNSLTWISAQDAEITDTTGRLYIEEDSEGLVLGKKLYITRIQEGDAGKYSCRTTVGERALSKDVTLMLYKDITFEEFPVQQNPKIYEDALISCIVSGSPSPVVSWRHRGRRLHGGARYSIDAATGLTIKNITEADNGVYVCRGEVEADGRYKEREITVTVDIPPTITVPLAIKDTVQGNSLLISCEADGLPTPTYQFFKDDSDVPLTSGDDVDVNETLGTITFSSVKKSDEGNYTCKATNRVGSHSATGSLKVLVKPSISEFDDVVKVEGNEARLVCTSDGDPVPQLTLRKEGSADSYQLGSNEDDRLTLSSSQPNQLELTISRLQIVDSGNYICTSTNLVDSDQKTAKLTVQSKPSFAENKATVYNWVGKSHNLTCEPSGEPTPTVTWVLSDVVLESNDTFRIYNLGGSSVLEVTVREIDQSWIYDQYVCRAKNDHGVADRVIDMLRATAPNSPKSVTIAESLPTTIVLNVEPPEEDGGVHVTGYNVEYSVKVQPTTIDSTEISGMSDGNQTESPEPEAEFQPEAHEMESSEPTIRIENLKSDTTYLFKVRARNEIGLGSAFESTASTIAFSKPGQIVINSPNKSEHPSEYRVTWARPVNGGQPIQQYELKFKRVEYKHGTQQVEDVQGEEWGSQFFKANGDVHSYTVKDLQPNSYYQLVIAAENAVGWSEPSNTFVFNTIEDPNASTSTPEAETTTVAVLVAETSKAIEEDEDDGEPSETAYSRSQQAGVSTGVIVGGVLALLVIFLIVVDVSCYFLNRRGVTNAICTKLGKKNKSKEKAMEEGEREQLNKSPEEKDPDLKDVSKDEIPMKDPKAVDSEDVDLLSKSDTTAAI